MRVILGKPGRKNSANTVVIDDFDIWNIDYTLARIIHPLLLRFRENMQGYPELFEEGMVTYHNWDRQLHFDFIDENLFFELTTGTFTYTFLPQLFIFLPCSIIES